MDNVERVIIACPKCKQKLRCEAGGAGTCPKCGTHVTFPDSIYQADPELNRFELERIYREKNKPTEEDEEEEKGGRKGGKIIKRILLMIVLLLVIGGLVFGGLKVKDMLTKSDDKKEANAYTIGTWVTDSDTVATL